MALIDPDARLMLLAAKGDREAFDRLMDRHVASIVGLAFRYLGSREDADDIAQEVFLKVYHARERYRPDAKFSTWVYRITANLCLNWIRNRRNRRSLPMSSMTDLSIDGEPEDFSGRIEDERGRTPLEKMADEEAHREIRNCLAELPDRQRLAVVLNKYDGLCYQEIANVLGLSVVAVKSLLFRARETLKERLAPQVQARATAEE